MCKQFLPFVVGLLTLSFFVLPQTCFETGDVFAGEKKEKKEKKKKTGKVIGIITAKGKNHIEVKGFGEVKGRKYFPRWTGGLPKDGGGFDKKILATFRKLKVGDRIRLTWEFEERPRAVQIKLLKREK